MVYLILFVAIFLALVGKEAGQLVGLHILMALCALVGSLFVGGGLIFLAVIARFV